MTTALQVLASTAFVAFVVGGLVLMLSPQPPPHGWCACDGCKRHYRTPGPKEDA